nr:aminopeptidase P N-terminal domain-containing protein [Mucilaginibacter humi]
MKYLPIENNLFINNRKNFVSRLKSGSVAIFYANDEYPRSGDQTFIFKQNPDFFIYRVLIRNKVSCCYFRIVLILYTKKYCF